MIIPNILKNKKCPKPPTRSENRPCLAPLGLQTFAGPFLPALEAALQFPQRRLTAERGARMFGDAMGTKTMGKMEGLTNNDKG